VCCDREALELGRSCERARGLELEILRLRMRSCHRRHFHPASNKQASHHPGISSSHQQRNAIQQPIRSHDSQTWLISQKATLCTEDSSGRSCLKSISQRSSCPLWTRSRSSCLPTMSATQSSTLIRVPYATVATRVIYDFNLT
jgi:hypothetical protein